MRAEKIWAGTFSISVKMMELVSYLSQERHGFPKVSSEDGVRTKHL